jgi:hypothetical protein
VSTLLHATVYAFTQFAECTGTDCKYNGFKKLSAPFTPVPAIITPIFSKTSVALHCRLISLGYLTRFPAVTHAVSTESFLCCFLVLPGSRDIIVGIPTSHGRDDGGVRFRVRYGQEDSRRCRAKSSWPFSLLSITRVKTRP